LHETPGQGALFREVEVIAELIALSGQNAPLQATPEREYKKPSKDKPGRKALASHLSLIEVRHELPEADRVFACGGVRAEIIVEPSVQLDFNCAGGGNWPARLSL
jgi:hypothetical protein